MKIVVTGGHLTPALAVIDALHQNYPDINIEFIGRKYTREGDVAPSVEYDLVSQKNIPFYSITAGRIQRTFTSHTIPSLLKIPLGLFQALKLLWQIKPDAVASFGGYLAVPVAIAGWILRIPVITHEQTLHSGLANKVIALFASKVLVSFSPTLKDFPDHKTVLVGNPIRRDVKQIQQSLPIDPTVPTIYITGGNMGSHAINTLIFEILDVLTEKYNVIHQTGNASESADFKKAIELQKGLKHPQRYHVFEYIGPQHIGFILQNADLIIGRSGANTVCEVLALGKKALFIPLHKEQQANADFAQTTGLCKTLPKEISASQLLTEITDTLSHKISQQAIDTIKSRMPLDADQKIARIIVDEIKRV